MFQIKQNLQALSTGFWGKEAWHPTPKWNTRFFFAFSKRTQLWLSKFVWKMPKKVWYYEKWVGRHASFPPRRSVKEVQSWPSSYNMFETRILKPDIVSSARRSGVIPLRSAPPTLQRCSYRGGLGRLAPCPPLSEFGRSVNPIQTRGSRLCPTYYCQPLWIEKDVYTSALGSLFGSKWGRGDLFSWPTPMIM